MARMEWPVRRLQVEFHAALSCLRAAVRPSGSAAAPGGRFIKGWPSASENIDQHHRLMIYL
jgi:hypothetical protein